MLQYKIVEIQNNSTNRIEMKIVFLLFTLFSSKVSAQCQLNCAVGQTCYTQADKGLECLMSIPFNEVIIPPFFQTAIYKI